MSMEHVVALDGPMRNRLLQLWLDSHTEKRTKIDDVVLFRMLIVENHERQQEIKRLQDQIDELRGRLQLW